MKFKTYKEYKDDQRKRFNELPLFWAFSDEQLIKHMRERGLSNTDFDELISCKGLNGAFCLKKDRQAVIDYLNEKDPLPELMADPKFAEDAFLYDGNFAKLKRAL